MPGRLGKLVGQGPDTSLRQKTYEVVMFRTANQVATHQEPWATVFRRGLREVVEFVCGHMSIVRDRYEWGSPLFARLTNRQKTAMLAIVGEALLVEEVPPPQLTAVVDATLNEILNGFTTAICVESDSRSVDESEWSGECRRALRSIFEPEWTDQQMEECTTQEWLEMVANLRECVLWDEDFLDEDLYLDQSPEFAGGLKEAMGIRSDYFTAAAPDPNDEELARHVATLAQLLGEKLDPEDAAAD
jgi:hypothetical protein